MSLKGRLGRAARGLVRRYAEKMTGLSRAQLTRLIARYTASRRVQAAAYRRQRFPQRYSRADLELLAAVDEAHETLGGPATRRILECEFEVYKRPEYARLHPTDEDLSVGTPVFHPSHRSSSPGWMIRKHIGYGYIDSSHAEAIDSFYREYLNPYLNYHRPCAQADVKIDEKGRKRVCYKRYQTPLETLLLLDSPAQYLRDGLSINALKRIGAAIGDTDAARRM